MAQEEEGKSAYENQGLRHEVGYDGLPGGADIAQSGKFPQSQILKDLHQDLNWEPIHEIGG